MASKIIKVIALLGCLILVFFEVYEAHTALPQNAYIRIALIRDAQEVTLSIRGRYRIINPESNTQIKEGRVLRKTHARSVEGGIALGETVYPFKSLRIIAHKDVGLTIGKREHRYREVVDIIKAEDGTFLVVNIINLEQYIKGVLYHEVSHHWPLEAIKAQAVAVRTYALYQMKENKSKSFDVTSDIYSQVYGGRNAERYRTNIAVNRTQGEILMYKNDFLPAYYSSNCGGHTEDVKELWDQDLAPLKGVICPFCQTAPNSSWIKNFRSKTVQDQLYDKGIETGAIKEIKVLERNQSGRIKILEFIDRQGKSVKISGKEFRNIIGPNVLKSNKYDVVMKGYYFDVVGQGWGHGVGLCQWGAFSMSHQGFRYKEILNFYYPGAEVVKY